jgi:HlyD family secretion protein
VKIARNRWRWIAIAVLLMAGGLAMLASARAQRVPVRLVRATRSALVVPVLCAGTLQPPPGGELRAAEGGLITAILVTEGERVRKGDALLKLDAPELLPRAFTAREELQQLREAQAVAEAQLEGAKREVDYRRQVLEADARLLAQAAISRSAYEADELAARQAEARLREAEARLQSLHAGSEGSASRLGLAAARAHDLAGRVAALTVRAPADGVVFGLPHRVGEPVAPGQVVANVSDPEQRHVRLRVDPPDLPRVAVGQRFIVTFDGLPDRQWEGWIESVGPGLREASGREVGEVLGVIRGSGQALPFSATVNARIVVGERPSALLLPRAAVQREGDRRFVYVERGGRAEPRDISVGLIGLTEVEVTAGLQEGESVVLPGEVPLSPGLRIDTGR